MGVTRKNDKKHEFMLVGLVQPPRRLMWCSHSPQTCRGRRSATITTTSRTTNAKTSAIIFADSELRKTWVEVLKLINILIVFSILSEIN